MTKTGSIKKRKEYLAVAAYGKKWVTPSFILQIRPWQKGEIEKYNNEPFIRFGITASKKTGNAVKRSRIRRRLRALAHEFLPLWCKPYFDIVIIARHSIWDKSHKDLQADLHKALKKIDLLDHQHIS